MVLNEILSPVLLKQDALLITLDFSRFVEGEGSVSFVGYRNLQFLFNLSEMTSLNSYPRLTLH